MLKFFALPFITSLLLWCMEMQAYGADYDTVYVDSALGNNSYNGLSPVFMGGNTGPKATIQEGVNVTNAGGWCFVAKGTYQENVIMTKDISLIGGGAKATKVHGWLAATNVKGKIEGFTVMNSDATLGSICLWDTCSVVVKNNIIRNCDRRGLGMSHGTNIILNNLIIYNKAKGLFSATAYYNIIVNNTIAYNGYVFDRCAYNSEPGLFSTGVTSLLLNNIIVSDSAGIELRLLPGDSVTVSVRYNNIWCKRICYRIWDTTYYVIGIGDTTWGVNRNGVPCDSFYNISRDPMFVALGEDSFYLSQISAGQAMQSPCIDAGDTFAGVWGLDTYTTRTDSVNDSGYIDIGFHYGGINGPQWLEELRPEVRTEPMCKIFSNPTTQFVTIVYYTPIATCVSVKVYDRAGRLVKDLTKEEKEPGYHNIGFDTKDLSSGVYLVKFEAGAYKESKKLIVIK